MYTDLGPMPIAEYTEKLKEAKWEDHDESYQVSQRFDLPEGYGIFFKLPPGGHLFRHADTGYAVHIPIQTNYQVVSMTYQDGVCTEHHLEVGRAYHVDRSIEHEAFNRGTTDRIHLVMVLK